MDLTRIKQLRDITGASVADCNTALQSSGGDVKTALELLRKRGLEIAHKKSARTTAEGAIVSYIHSNAKVGAMVMLKCETDFVARNADFLALAKELAMQVAAMNPLYITPESVPQEILDKEKEIEREKLNHENKPENIINTILEGKINKFFELVVLIKQIYIKDNSKTIEDLIREHIQKLGENIEVAQCVRLEL